MPFSGPPSAQRQKIIQNKYAMVGDCWKMVSTMGKHFVKSLLEAVPEKRLSAQDALEHTWLLQQRRRTQQFKVDRPMVEAMPASNKAQFAPPFVQAADGWVPLRSEFGTGMPNLLDTRQAKLPPSPATGIGECAATLIPDHGSGIKYAEVLASMFSRKLTYLNDGLLLSAFTRLDQGKARFTGAGDIRSVLGEANHGESVGDRLHVDADVMQTVVPSNETHRCALLPLKCRNPDHRQLPVSSMKLQHPQLYTVAADPKAVALGGCKPRLKHRFTEQAENAAKRTRMLSRH
eukprot:CAMPEP_0172939192 /NCGR_PEP_ID=MMETSP1075-20121228/223406_1 /TAXON_ID=2916 /ORGANISM="Ceratium fusus, Strain PA161109" /LENGTH=289 /DNA_ID=CAMNT_0013800579 /DNA_START=1 /DNA_END=869 /DNA_ORIENTATION=-